MKTIAKVAGLAAIVALLFVAGCKCGCSRCEDTRAVVVADATAPPASDAGAAHSGSGPVNFSANINNSADVDLPVPLISQITSMWCWAASAEMTMQYLKHDVSECDQVNFATGQTNCCSEQCPYTDESSACVTGKWPDYAHWNFEAEQTQSQALSWDELTGELRAGRPVAFSWQWDGGGGHMMVAHGFQTQDQQVEVNDPWPPCEGSAYVISYNDYVSYAGYYAHWNDFYRLKNLNPQTVSINPISAPRLAVATPVLAAPAPNASSTITLINAAASAGFAKLAPTFPRELGLSPGIGPGNVSLGAPIKMSMVRLDQLKTFTSSADPNALIHDTGEYLVPVVSNGPPAPGPISAIIVGRTGAGFRTVAAGYAPLVRAVSAGLANLPAGISKMPLRLVQIPALHVDFLAYRDGTSLKLRPLPPAKAPTLLPLILLGNANAPLPAEFTARDAFLGAQKRAKAIPKEFPN